MATGGLLLLLLSIIGLSLAYVESLAGSAASNVEILDDRLKKKFEPQVAVKCGYLNQYMMENGHWAANKYPGTTVIRNFLWPALKILTVWVKHEYLSLCSQDRIDKMMKEWTDVSQRYKELKKSDPQGAKKLKSDLMSRVRKTMSALEEEYKEQKRQLTELHRQRIDVQLNERKRQSMDEYLDAIQERRPKASKLYNALEKYIRAEEKDREHTVKRYRHLLDSDPVKAEATLPSILAHLSDLDQRINESMKMLNRVPETIARDVERRARTFWASHRREMFGEGTNEEILKKNKQKFIAEDNRDKISVQRDLEEKFDQLESIDSDEDDLVQSEPESEKEVTTAATTPVPTIDDDGLDFLPRNRPTPIPHVAILSTVTSTADPDDEDDVVEDESAIDNEEAELEKDDNDLERESVPLRKFQDVSSVANAKLHREEQAPHASVQRIAVSDTESNASRILYIGLGLVGVAFFAGLLLLIVVLRRKNPRKEGFAPVDTYATPEERHVATMQAHGYTNPFFNHNHANQYSKA
ncbi:amyloid-beta-like protein [Paramacrobiotus metropolitanus]|uniref:amyloid-beta-like protein n=1 Tax=Paramacrobiotus metropolitanus TaxID=2943436 RepID=UPI002445CD03|nr:amyloid-beta-like protein [Paramacrobiotus metropolitanus]